MILNFWAVIVAAIGWFIVGKLIAERAKLNKSGKVPVPARYLTRHSTGTEVVWKIKETQPAGFKFIFSMIALSTVPLITLNIPWLWLVITILSILSLVILFLFWETFSYVLYYREIGRQDNDEGGYDITFQLENAPFSKKKGALTVFILALFWMPAYWIVGSLGINDWMLVGIMFGGFILMIYLMYQREQREQKWKVDSPADYCKRCGESLESKERPSVSREHAGGNYFTETTEWKVFRTCQLCGYEESY